jgi:surface antigen
VNQGIVRALAPALMAAFVLGACASVGRGIEQAGEKIQENPKAVLGTVVGAAGGGLIAAAAGGGTGWIVAGSLLGGMAGGYVGHKLDARDTRMAEEAAARAFEQNRTGQTSTWTNPDSGHSGTITPTKTYQLASGQYCRRYTQTIDVGGEPQQASGTACRRADGTWEVQ